VFLIGVEPAVWFP